LKSDRVSKIQRFIIIMLKVFLVIWLLGRIAAQNTNLESLNKRIKVGLVAVQLDEED
jgi:hypothetical protein